MRPASPAPSHTLIPELAVVAGAVAAVVVLRLVGAPLHGAAWLAAALVAGFSLSGSV